MYDIIEIDNRNLTSVKHIVSFDKAFEIAKQMFLKILQNYDFDEENVNWLKECFKNNDLDVEIIAGEIGYGYAVNNFTANFWVNDLNYNYDIYIEESEIVDKDTTPQLVGQIVDIFEDFLDDKGIDIPNPEKEDYGADEDEMAIIFGDDYDAIADPVRELLNNWGIINNS